MQFSLKTLLILFVVLAASLAAFGAFGIFITIACIFTGLLFQALRLTLRSLINFMAFFVLFCGVCTIFLSLCTSAVRECGRRATCMNNLKNIALALHDYHSMHGYFPKAYLTDKSAKPMHSWRMQLMPYIERNDIYGSYHFNEPWDGQNNQKHTTTCQHLFRCPSNGIENWDKPLTNYIAVIGPGTIWPGDKSTRMEDIKDGPENTILLVEIADSDICWAEPRDITLEDALGKSNDDPANVPASNHIGEDSYFFKGRPIAGHVVMADGSVRLLYKRLSSKDMAAMLSIAGGEKIDESVFDESYRFMSWHDPRWDHVVGLPLFFVSVIFFWISLVKDATRAKTDAGSSVDTEQPAG